MVSKSGLGILAIALVAVAPVFAGNGDPRAYAPAAPDYDYAQVVDVDPIMREVRVVVPRQQCFSETRYVPVSPRSAERPAAGPMILGGLVGAVVGHQLGNHRDTRRTGTLAGAVIGTAIGHDVAQRRATPYDSGEVRAVESQRCETFEEEHFEQQVDGYHVTYRYNGRLYNTRMPHDPGPRLRVRVAVEPVV